MDWFFFSVSDLPNASSTFLTFAGWHGAKKFEIYDDSEPLFPTLNQKKTTLSYIFYLLREAFLNVQRSRSSHYGLKYNCAINIQRHAFVIFLLRIIHGKEFSWNQSQEFHISTASFWFHFPTFVNLFTVNRICVMRLWLLACGIPKRQWATPSFDVRDR